MSIFKEKSPKIFISAFLLLLSITLYFVTKEFFFYMDKDADNSICVTNGYEGDINVIKCHGAEPVTDDTTLNIRDSIPIWRKIMTPIMPLGQSPTPRTVYFLPYEKIKDMCYPFPNFSGESIFGVHIYIINAPLSTQLLVVPSKWSLLNGTFSNMRGIRNNNIKYEKIFNNCLLLSNNNTFSEISGEEVQELIRASSNNNSIKGYFLGRNLLMSNIKTTDGTHLKIELIKNINNCSNNGINRGFHQIGFLLESVVNTNISLVDYTQQRIYYCLPANCKNEDTESPSGRSCTLPCPNHCPE